MNNVNIPKRQTYHHGNLREALIKAGLRAISEDGPDGFSLRDVATRAGVTAPAVYRHFKDKDALLAAIAAECSERQGAMIEGALAEHDDNALGRFRLIGMAYVQFAAQYPEHFRAITHPGVLERLPSEERAHRDAVIAEQRKDLEAGIAAGQIADIPVDELLLAANSLVHGLAHLIVEGQLGEVDATRAKELAIAATGAIGVGFIPRETPHGDPMRPKPKRRR